MGTAFNLTNSQPGAYETVTTFTAAKGLTKATFWPTSGVYSGMSPKEAIVSCEVAAVNYTLDGTTPTVAAGTNAGLLLDIGDALNLVGIESIRNFKAINRIASNGAVLKVIYFY